MKRFLLINLVEMWRVNFVAKLLRPIGLQTPQRAPANIKFAHRHIGSNVYVMPIAPAKSQNADLLKKNQIIESAESSARKQFDVGDLGLTHFAKAQISTRVWLVRMCARLMGVAVCVSAQPTR